MNFSGISIKSLPGKVLRWILRFIPPKTRMPILQGRLRGKKWVVGTSNHGYWLGSYEYDKRKIYEAAIKEGSIVYDLGGNVGYYSLLSSVLVGRRGKVFVFEPVPRNVEIIREHMRINHVQNAVIFEAAVADHEGEVTFDQGPSFAMGHISEKGGLRVRTVGLDELYHKGELPLPDTIKLDIEGGEFVALQGARHILEKAHPQIFLATHGAEVHRQCLEYLRSYGYSFTSLRKGKAVEDSDEVLAVFHPG